MALTAPAASAQCRLALVLAIDVSSSVDAEEDALQRRGLATALRAPEIQRAFFASDLPVALSVTLPLPVALLLSGFSVAFLGCFSK